MGSRLFSNTSSLYAGYDFKQESHREKIAKALNIDPGIIPDRDSWPYDKIVEGIRSGKIKGLWISGIQRKLTLKNLMFPIKLLCSLWNMS